MQDAPPPVDKPSRPTVAELCLEAPLYRAYPDGLRLARELTFFDGTFDCYCAGCNSKSVFSHINRSLIALERRKADAAQPLRTVVRRPDPAPPQPEYVSLQLRCERNRSHPSLLFFFRIVGGEIVKVGQHPSPADLYEADLRDYRPILGAERYAEFVKAIRLGSHDVGAGAFVYLRRVFEFLIEEAHKREKAASSSWEEKTYLGARMVDRIRMLAHQLPGFLVESRSLWAIMGKAVHELSEEECLKAFPIIKTGIELILDEEMLRREREAKIAGTQKAIADMHRQLSDKKP